MTINPIPKSTSDWETAASQLKITNQAFINGSFTDSYSRQTFPCINPATGANIADISSCSEQDVDLAVKAAKNAFSCRIWADKTPKQRKQTLLKVADLMEAAKRELALLETLDMGKPIQFALKDVAGSIDTYRWYAEAIDKVYGETGPAGAHDLSLILREPLGVIGVIVPWNFPLLMASWKIAPALAMGNSVILKPAEQSPLSALKMAEIFNEAGLPAGVFNVLPGFGETAGQALGRHMDVDMIAFTGSTQVGKLFLQYSGQSNMKHISLECGGKSANIILQDVPDIDAAAKAAASAIFYNQGEVCTAGSRLFVESSIHNEFMTALKKHAKSWVVGNPLDPTTNFGSIVNETQMNSILNYIKIGQKEGDLVLGGNQVLANTGGYYIEPTIFSNVASNAQIAREEIFGPVLSVIEFDTPEQALAHANSSEYGLAAAVWSRDLNKAISIARRLEAGMVWINSWSPDDITMPFGGYKQSGIGRDRSLHALEKYSEIKSLWIKHS
ncbi:MAG: aldehyde dehydrogenase [Hyphomicrobiales bacterium]